MKSTRFKRPNIPHTHTQAKQNHQFKTTNYKNAIEKIDYMIMKKIHLNQLAQTHSEESVENGMK